MKPLRGIVSACAAALLAATPAWAAWDNVFQVCCNGCGSQPSASYYVPAVAPTVAASPCCPPPTRVCTTRYVQRCYYQPVTAYTTRTYYEAVTSYRTSYYWEPVTSYRYSCYYDPCTCSYQQVACPTTSYQLRSQCCPVQNWVQRCCQVPVTTYQQRFYYEPVTSCCEQPAPCPTACAAAPCSTAPAIAAPPAGVTEQGTVPNSAIPPAGVRESTGTGTSAPQTDQRLYPQYRSYMPPVNSAGRQAPAPAPKVRLDRIVAAPQAQVAGQVVSTNERPAAGAEVLFVSAALHGPQETVAADQVGKFRVTLASGGWLVYVKPQGGKPVFYSKIEIKDNENRNFLLVSR